jgi:hypothetical protein
MAKYTLVNSNGGFAFITAEQAKVWQKNPSEAVDQFITLKEELNRQTHNRGYNYSDYTLQFNVRKSVIRFKQK